MRRFLGIFAFACAIFFAPETSADEGVDIHWDVSAEAGVMKRFLGRKPKGAHDAGFGPSAQLAAHFALLPLVNVGGYLGGDYSPIKDGANRFIGDGGLHVKGMIPFFPRSMRGWIYAGFGYATQNHGGFFEVPVGLGASYKFWPGWSVFSELGTRFGFASHGSAYPSGTSVDRFALGLSLGIMLDR